MVHNGNNNKIRISKLHTLGVSFSYYMLLTGQQGAVFIMTWLLD